MSLKNLFFTAAGLILLGIGALGLFLPVLPTTPFVLASAYCLTYNPKLREKVMQIPFFNEYIENYQSRQGLAKKTVVKSLVYLWGMLILTSVLMKSIWLALLLAAIGAGVTYHILWIAKPRERPRQLP